MIPQTLTHVLDLLSSFVLIGLALDHLVTGFIGFFLPHKSEALITKMFGITITDKEFYKMIVRPWGALGIFACGVGILPIIDPTRFKPVSYMLIVLLLLRIYYRLEEAKKAKVVLGVTSSRNLFHIFLIVLCILSVIEKIIV